MEILQFAVNIMMVSIIILLTEKHKKDLQNVYREHAEEREALLDRIMSNNIHEFKATNGQSPVKRSPSGNYLMDRMKVAYTKDFDELDE